MTTKVEGEVKPVVKVLKKPYVNTDDPTLLLVMGSQHPDTNNQEDLDKMREDNKNYVKKLAMAIFSVYTKHGVANLRCVGASALNNAFKASAIAKGELSKKGMNIALDPSFQTVNFDSEDKPSVPRTAMVLKVVKRAD